MHPATIGPFEVQRELGRGGMGEVFLARDTRLERLVAVKALPAHLAQHPDRLARFQREAKVLAALNHPGIGAIYGLEEAAGRRYLILEFIEGETLAGRIARGPIPAPEALALASQIAGALEAAHAKGIVHRDLKPGNVMVTPAGAAKVLDFGLAATADEASRPGGEVCADSPTTTRPATPATTPGAVMGTAGYMSPEQARGLPVDPRSDVFSFGVVVYEMLTGRSPFAAGTVAEALGATMHKEVDATLLPPSVPSELRRLLAACLDKDPARRPVSGAALSAAVASVRGWARDEGIPELVRVCERILVLEEGRESWTAFELSCEIEKLLPDDPILARLKPSYCNPISITTDPPGARAFASFYGDPPPPEGREIDLGVTPLHDRPFPRGLSRIRLELPGRPPVHDLLWNLSKGLNNATDTPSCIWHFAVPPPGQTPAGMVDIPAGGFPVFLAGLDHLPLEPTAAFQMDRHPVTNAEFKRFLDDGGYAREDLWPGPFQAADRALSREDAMALFVDQVGQPGPAGWEMGEFPAGEADHPVAGVSWHEAAAYAAWTGKALPTVFHWSRAAFTNASGQIAPPANFSGRGTVPVGRTRSVNRFGVHDLAGNVREWIANPIDRPGQRFILGGGWSDPSYAFVDAYAQAAMDRSASNGFRCVRLPTPDPNQARLTREIAVPFRDFRAETPVPDEVFSYFLRQFRYDRTPLDPVVLADRETPMGRWQTVEIAAGYGSERMQVHVMLPTKGQPPFQTVLLFPGSLALHTRQFTLNEIQRVDFLVRSGRAVVLPVYKGTFERGTDLNSDYPTETAQYRDHVVMWGKDVGRAIDLIESRGDLDAGRIAYYGVSWGGALGAIMPAVERRIRVNVLYVAGFCFQRTVPEADQINYITRVAQPTLMLNGELDFYFPPESSQRPMFDRLGTPPEHKKRLTYPRGHTVPKQELIRESLAWLDRYLGPAAPAAREGSGPA